MCTMMVRLVAVKSFYKNGRIRKGLFRRARSMEPSGAAHQPRALGTANPARILACLSLLRRLRARARPSRPTTFSDNMCALDDDASWDLTGYPGSGGHSQDMRIDRHTQHMSVCVPIDSRVLAMASRSRVSGEVQRRSSSNAHMLSVKVVGRDADGRARATRSRRRSDRHAIIRAGLAVPRALG